MATNSHVLNPLFQRSIHCLNWYGCAILWKILFLKGLSHLLRSSQESRRCDRHVLLGLRQWELVSALRALSHLALYRRWTPRTGQSSTIRYVEGEPAFGAIYELLRLRVHSNSLSKSQPFDNVLKTFPEITKQFHAETFRATSLLAKRTVKFIIKRMYEILLR